MNYSKKFNTTKKAIAEIKRLEKEYARLAGQLSNANIILKSEPDIKEITRLKSEIVQFRKTQDYQSDKIGRLQSEKREWIMDEAKYKQFAEKQKLHIKDQHDCIMGNLKSGRSDALKIKQFKETIIRQANELTDLKAGV